MIFSTQNNINTNFTTTDGFFNTDKNSNYNNKSDFSESNYNLIPHIQSPNPFTPGSRNYNSNHMNMTPNCYGLKKRSNSKSVLSSNSKKLIKILIN